MSTAKVSIIIPCYNQASYLDECLSSVYNQTHTEWECLIINDGSEDNTESVAKEWTLKDKRFAYYYKTNGGLSSARNYGLNKAQGEFIQFLDCDDLIETDKINYQLRCFLKEVNLDLVYGSARFFFNNAIEHSFLAREMNGEDWTFKRIAPDYNYLKSIADWNILVVSAPLIRKSLCEKVGLFNVSFKALEDWDYWIRCLLAGARFKYCESKENSLTLIRCYSGSMSTNQDLMIESELKLRIKYKKTIVHNIERYSQVQESYLLNISKKIKQSRINGLKMMMRDIDILSLSQILTLLRLFFSVSFGIRKK